MRTLQKYGTPQVGCYVDTSSQSADDCNQRTIKFAEGYGFESGLASDESQQGDEGEWSQLLSEVADRAVDFLNELETRSFLFWQFEDNSLFLLPDVELAKDDVGFVSSKSQDYPEADYRGEWLHVNDHGNCTLYVRGEDGKDAEVWSIV